MIRKENKVGNLKVGDQVDMHDGSYCFGIKDDKYTTNCSGIERKGLTVIEIGLNTMKMANGTREGDHTQVCDILVTDNKGGFWFTQTRFMKPPTFIITIGGKDIVISAESFASLKKQLCISD